MFAFCRQAHSANEIDILNHIQDCDEHNSPCSFICLQDQPECMKKPLLCLKCLQDHKTHNWESIQKYFDENFRKTVAAGTSSNAKQVEKFIHTTFSEIDKLRSKLNHKMDEINDDLKFEMKQMKKDYPYKTKFTISGQHLKNSNVNEFKEVRERQKKSQWISAASNFVVRMFRQTTNMIVNLLDDFHANLTGKQWEQLTAESSNNYVDKFMKQYEGVFSEDPHYFQFSLDQRARNIRVSQDQRQVKFLKSSPSKPTAIVIKPMNHHNNTVYFQIKKLQKTAIVFDKQLIVLGVCLPKTVKAYGYRGVMEPSHGGFAIGSNGRCYHTKLFQYEKTDSGFTFGEEDIITVSLDYDLKMVKFQKLTGFFKKKFQMELGIEDDQIPLLKPCVMFDGEQGAMVCLLEQFETTKKYQKNLKKKQRHIVKQQK